MTELTKSRLRLAANIIVIPAVFAGIIAGPWAATKAFADVEVRKSGNVVSTIVQGDVTPGMKSMGPYMPNVNDPEPVSTSDMQVKEAIKQRIFVSKETADLSRVSATCSGEWGKTVTVTETIDGKVQEVQKWKKAGEGNEIGVHTFDNEIGKALGVTVKPFTKRGFSEVLVPATVPAITAKIEALHNALPACGPEGGSKWKDPLDTYVNPETGKAYKDMTPDEKADIPIWGPGLH